MFLSAVSLTVVLATTPQTRTLTTAESDVNRATRSSVLTLVSGGEERGVAVCIDSAGYFIAHQNVLRFPVLVGRTRNGMSVQLNVCAKDQTTNLALLKAEGAVNQPFTAVSVAEEDGSARDFAFALIPGQVIKTEIVSSDKLGLVQTTRRAIPLLERGIGEDRFAIGLRRRRQRHGVGAEARRHRREERIGDRAPPEEIWLMPAKARAQLGPERDDARQIAELTGGVNGSHHELLLAISAPQENSLTIGIRFDPQPGHCTGVTQPFGSGSLGNGGERVQRGDSSQVRFQIVAHASVVA